MSLTTYTQSHWSDTPAQIKQRYDDDGFIVISGLIDDTIASRAADFLLTLPAMDGNIDDLKHPDLTVAERGLIEHFARQDDELRSCFSDDFFNATELLIGRELSHRPNGVQTQNLLTLDRDWHMPGPHIDGIPKENQLRTFPGPYEIAFIVYLSDVESQGGGTIGWAGSHKVIREFAESDPEEHALLYDLNKHVSHLDLGEPVEILPKQGDILFFQHLWAHGATFNINPDPRLAIRPLCSCTQCNTRWYKRDNWSFWQP